MKPRGPSLSVVLAAGVAVALRIMNYLRYTSLNIDESRIALNLGTRSYLGLFPPLEHEQSAPILFLWAEKLVIGLVGMNELTLRSVPLVAGIATVALLGPVARRLAGPRAAVIALSLAACAPGLVQYSVVLKQYTLEALVTVLMVILFLDWQDAPRSRRAQMALAAAGVIAVWASAPVVFVLAGIWLAIVLSPRRSGQRYPLVAGVSWAVSFGLAYLLVYRSAANNPYMARFWAPTFLNLEDPRGLQNAAIVLRSLVWGGQMETLPFVPRATPIWLAFHLLAVGLGCAMVVGILRLASTKGRACALAVAGPLVAVTLVSAFGRYPFARRTLLFALPLVLLAIAIGLATLPERVPPRHRRFVSTAVLACVLGLNLYVAALMAINTNPAYHLRPMVLALEGQRRVGEPLYVSAGAIPAWTYYSTDWSAPDRARIRLLDSLAAPGGPAFENAPSRGGPVPATEGLDLHYATPQGVELLGLPSGIESGALIGPLGEVGPDPGWTAHEAARIRRRACPVAWILMSQYRESEADLLEELQRQGGRRTFFRNTNGMLLARYEFGGGAGVSGGSPCPPPAQ